MRSLLLVAMLLILATCNRPPPGSNGEADNPLEAAARERGLVHEEAAALTGVFERRHDLGRDSLCVVPEGPANWRFSLSASYGPGMSCQASGTIKAEGDSWRFDFAGADGCSALLREKEDELQLPGSLPTACDSLCPSRASLSGLRLPRASWSEGDARRLQITDRRGSLTQPCAG